MEDFEYSVEISEHDWDCFIQECRECDVFSPALARVDDSGLSDIDDPGATLADRAVKAGQTAGLLEADRPIDGPPDCEGSPVERYLTRRTAGGMESVLSGSEEDIHLASVNTFFERIRSLAEAEKVTELSQEGVGENNEALQEEGRCNDGPQASNSARPKNIPKINSLPARGETATGRKATQTANGTPAEQNAKRNTKTRKNDVPDSKTMPDLTASNSHVETNKQTHADTESVIAEEPAVSTATDVREQSPPEADVCSDPAMMPPMCKHLDSMKQRVAGTDQTALNQIPNMETPSSLMAMAQDGPEEAKHLHSLPADPQPQSPKWSPSPSTKKKKRRKKKRISAEPVESGHGYERQFLANRSDSEEEPYSHGGGLDQPLSKECIACITETERTDCSSAPLPTYSDFFQRTATSNLLLKISSMGNNFKPLSPPIPLNDCQYQNLPARPVPSERLVLANTHVNDGICTAPEFSEENKSLKTQVLPPSPTGYIMSAPADGANVPTHLQPRCTKQLLKPVGLSKSSHMPDLITASDVSTGIGCGTSSGCSTCKREECLQPSDEIRSLTNLGCLSETTPESCAAEVISIAHLVLPSQMPEYRALEAGQNDQVVTAKTWLAREIGNSSRDTLVQRELKGDGPNVSMYRAAYENTICPLATTGTDMQELSANKTKQQHLNTAPSSTSNNNLSHETSIDLTLETSNSSPDTMHQMKHFHHQISKLDSVSENNSSLGIAESPPLHSHELNAFTSNRETRPNITMSQDMVKNLLEPAMSLSNTNIMEKACSSPGPNQLSPQILVADQNDEDISEPVQDLAELTFERSTEEPTTTTEAQKEVTDAPDSNNSVFTMSSFWSEMEKLTIKDILFLRMARKTPPSTYLSPLPEGEESESSDARDSGYFTYADTPMSENASDEMSGVPDSGVNPPSIMTDGSTQTTNVMWESDLDLGSGVYAQNILLTSARDSPLPRLPNGSDDKYSRKISKNASVRNLRALDSESFGNLWKERDLSTVIPQEGDSEEEFLADEQVPKRDSGMDSLSPSSFAEDESTASFRLSLTDIFQYVFGGKQSKSSPSDVDYVTTYTCMDGQSVPETYDHFFSDFDPGSLFYPLIETSDKSKDELVPIFSYPRSVNKNLQFPEAYEHFFTSSSSDESSGESDEEDDEGSRGPIRVVTRFSRETNDTQVTADIYENFFSDGDVKHNFFWKNTFSFRNVRLSSFMSQEQRSNSFILVPVKQSGPSWPERTIQSVNALGYQDKPFSDPVLFNLEDRISRQLAEQRFSFDDLQTAVSNPRLDASLLPLRQSDMCLVCIAFASWVLKTTNPQVGDAWKVALLANVSALSAIGYLRKYVRVKANADQRAPDHSAPM